ncbi:MAG TPA: 6-bladed beta-propeller [Gemmatimonadaceae bacterium]|nr:6-bladed beta-propeller [Gemmatimonadaceae bacterium]
MLSHRRPRPRSTSVLALVALAALAACSTAERDASSLTIERDTIGDTVVVRTVAGSVWGDSVRLVEELRIGDADAGDEYGFGQVADLAVGADGTIYVHDFAMKSIRAYDAQGRFLRAIGAQGAGPGEYEEVIGLAVLPDGRLLLRDAGLGRINVYSADGEPLGAWPFSAGLYASDMVRTDTAGRVYLKILTDDLRNVAQGDPWPMGYVRLDATGAVIDTIPMPRWMEEVRNGAVYDPVGHWTWHPHGYMVAAFGARYGVELRRPGEPVLRIERAGQPTLPVPPGERSELDARFAEMRRQGRFGRNAPPLRPVPAVKPAIRALATGADGRIWVRPSMPSVESTEPVDTTLSIADRPRRWKERTAWDVFEPDGTFLGRITLPERAVIHAMRGDTLWGTVRDEDDVPSVVRWRIERGDASGDQ